MELPRFSYNFRIDNKNFSEEIRLSEESGDDVFNLDIFPYLAPIYYSYKYKDNEQMKNIISDYTLVSVNLFNTYEDLKYLNSEEINKISFDDRVYVLPFSALNLVSALDNLQLI